MRVKDLFEFFAIVRAVVDDNHFIVFELLRLHRIQRLSNVAGGIVDRNHDRYCRCVPHFTTRDDHSSWTADYTDKSGFIRVICDPALARVSVLASLPASRRYAANHVSRTAGHV